MKRKLTLTLALLVVSLGLCIAANAQKGKLFKGVDWKKAVEAAKNGNAKIDKDMAAKIEAVYAEKIPETNDAVSANLTGTWYITVPGPTSEENF